MNELFHSDNPSVQFLARMGDLIIVNVLFLICCIPFFTIGAASAALHKVTQDIVQDEKKGIFKTFFRAFRENFKQATIAWLIAAVLLLGMGCNFLLVNAYFTGSTALILICVLALILALILSVIACLFPLMARYDNTLKEHTINAGILTVIKLPKVLGIVLANILPFLILYVSIHTFLGTLAYWLILGFGFNGYLTSTLLAPVFEEMEAPGGPNMQIWK